MKHKIKILNVFLVIVFLLGTLLSAYILFNLTTNLEMASVSIAATAIDEAAFVFSKLYLIIGITLLAGVATSLRLLYLGKTRTESKSSSSISTDEPTVKVKASRNHKSIEKKQLKMDIREIQLAATGTQDPKEFYQTLLSKLCMKLEASQGLIYEMKKAKDREFLELIASFSFQIPEDSNLTFDLGHGLVGQVAETGTLMNIDNIPEGYIKISSGLGASSMANLVIIPILQGKIVSHVVEIASFKKISAYDEKLIAGALSDGREVNTKSKIRKKSSKRQDEGKRVSISA